LSILSRTVLYFVTFLRIIGQLPENLTQVSYIFTVPIHFVFNCAIVMPMKLSHS